MVVKAAVNTVTGVEDIDTHSGTILVTCDGLGLRIIDKI
jgi:hypothetical protein